MTTIEETFNLHNDFDKFLTYKGYNNLPESELSRLFAAYIEGRKQGIPETNIG